MYSRIIGTGGYLPEKKRTNHDLETMVDTSNAWIIERTGIQQRSIAAIDETVADIGFYAAQRALIAANITPQEIDLIVVATTSSSHAFPSSACQIQHLLEIEDAISFDISAACTGFCYALSIADQYVKNGAVQHALVIGADILSRMLDPNDRNTIILFGDGAGAIVLQSQNRPGILSTTLHADGAYKKQLALLYRHHPEQSPAYITMMGSEVFKFAIKRMVSMVTDTLAAHHLKIEDIDWIIPHQANLRIIHAVAEQLNVKYEKFIITLVEQGNTSAASIPLALNHAIQNSTIKTGDLVLLEAFGAGFTWGSALIRI